MSTVEIRDPGDGTFTGLPEICVDGVRIPGVMSWSLEGGQGCPMPELTLRCTTPFKVHREGNAVVEYFFGLPRSRQYLEELKAAVEEMLEEINGG